MTGKLTAAPRFEVGDVLRALYRTLLLREPSATELAIWSNAVNERGLTAEDTIKSFLQSSEFQQRAEQFVTANAPAALYRRGAQTALSDHSQFGEVVILLKLMVNGAATNRIVVDVGANGRERSNSYDLMTDFGWSGLLIEANPALAACIAQEFTGLPYRLADVAISDFTGATKMFLGVNSDISSLNQSATASWGSVSGSVEVRVERLHDVLAKYDIPHDFDLLSLDIEGEDVKTLNDLVANSAYRPRWIIIEASYNFATRTLAQVGLSQVVADAYRIVGQTPANLILCRCWRSTDREPFCL